VPGNLEGNEIGKIKFGKIFEEVLCPLLIGPKK
jgi:hypothetical protein